MANLSRRKFLLGGGATVALLPLSYAVRVSFGGYHYSKTFEFITEKEAVIFESLCSAIIPDQNPFGPTVKDVDVVTQFDRFLRSCSEPERGEIRILLWVVEHAFPAIGGSFKKFTQMTVEERQLALRRLDNMGWSISKLIARGAKTLVTFAYFNTPQLQERLGIKGWCGP